MSEPILVIGDLFYSDGTRYEVVGAPFFQGSAEGEQWWYPAREPAVWNIKESLIDKEDSECGKTYQYDH